MYLICSFVLFFFKQKTAYEMRISDWSSDVCSSDLEADMGLYEGLVACGHQRADQHRDQQHRQRDRRQAVDLQAAVGAVPGGEAAARRRRIPIERGWLQRGRRDLRRGVSHKLGRAPD